MRLQTGTQLFVEIYHRDSRFRTICQSPRVDPTSKTISPLERTMKIVDEGEA